MNCHTARQRILEADLHELEIAGESALSRHLRACAECRASAASVLSWTAQLDGALSAPPTTPDALLAKPRRRRALSLRRSAPGAAVAAAAAILAVLLLARPWQTPTRWAAPAVAVASERPHPVVEDTGGAAIAVFATANPSITVVWIYDQEER